MKMMCVHNICLDQKKIKQFVHCSLTVEIMSENKSLEVQVVKQTHKRKHSKTSIN